MLSHSWSPVPPAHLGMPSRRETRSSWPPGFTVTQPTSCLVSLWCVALSAIKLTGGRQSVASSLFPSISFILLLTAAARWGRNLVTKL